MLAMARVSQWHLLSDSPRPAERLSTSEAADVITQVEAALELLSAAADQSPSVAMFTELQGPLHAEAATLLTDLGRPGGDRPDPELIARARGHMAQVPAEMLDQLPPVVRDVFLLQRIVADGSPPEPAEAERLAARFGEVFETSGADLAAVDAAVSRARQSQKADDIGAALGELNKVTIAMLPGGTQRAHVLISLAEMQSLLAVQSSASLALADAIDAAMEATRAARTPAEKKSTAQRLTVVFSLMTARGHREGPFEQAEELLRAALADASPDDWSLRVMATVGMGAAVGMRAAASDDQDLHHSAVALIEDAERLLPEARSDGDWYGTARILYSWTAAHALFAPDPELAAIALRTLDRLEGALPHQATAAGASAANDALSRGARRAARRADPPAGGIPVGAGERARRLAAASQAARAGAPAGPQWPGQVCRRRQPARARWPPAAAARGGWPPRPRVAAGCHDRPARRVGGHIR